MATAKQRRQQRQVKRDERRLDALEAKAYAAERAMAYLEANPEATNAEVVAAVTDGAQKDGWDIMAILAIVQAIIELLSQFRK